MSGLGTSSPAAFADQASGVEDHAGGAIDAAPICPVKNAAGGARRAGSSLPYALTVATSIAEFSAPCALASGEKSIRSGAVANAKGDSHKSARLAIHAMNNTANTISGWPR